MPWGLLSYVCAISPFIGFIAMLFIPESPVWLNCKGKTTEALQAATWLKNETVLANIDVSKNTIEHTDM